jgi:hypothetical protein
MSSVTTHGEAGVPMTMPQFLEAIDQISGQHSRAENFRYFMEAAYCALAMRTEPDAAHAAALETRYVAVGRNFKDPQETMGYLSLLLNRLWLTIAQYKGDFLGEASQHPEMAVKQTTQYFMPYAKAVERAALLIAPDDLGRRVARAHPITLLDPACGSGGMVIAAAARVESFVFDPREVLLATLISEDQLSLQMAFLQMWFKGIPAICIHGDSLRSTAFGRACTPAAFRQWQRIAESDELLLLRSEPSAAAPTSPDASTERDAGSEEVTPATKPASTTEGTSRRKHRRSPRKG